MNQLNQSDQSEKITNQKSRLVSINSICPMDTSAAEAFCYAKASGILRKSFVGENANKLFAAKSLKELYTLLFGDNIPAVPEVMLAKEIEKKAAERFENGAKELFGFFEKPAPILSAIFDYYEYENSGENDSKKDREEILNLWKAAGELHSNDKKNLEKLFKTVISFRNIIWAMRLKVYYQFSKEEVAENLVYADEKKSEKDVLAREALEILDKDVSNYDDWKKWKYVQTLNPHEEGTIWEIDPVWVENYVKRYLANFYQRAFHKNPMSVTSLVAWFRIKQNELDYIRAAAEGLRLSVPAGEVKKAAGFETGEKA